MERSLVVPLVLLDNGSVVSQDALHLSSHFREVDELPEAHETISLLSIEHRLLVMSAKFFFSLSFEGSSSSRS